MKILAIDTSSDACSAALCIDGETEVQFKIAPQQHSRLILRQCDKLFADANILPQQLDAVAFARGPGSFTGLRIAAGVTQGIAFAHDIPVIAISTLAAQAQKISTEHPAHHYFSCIDARMNEIYWGVYALSDKHVVEPLSEESVSLSNEISWPDSQQLIGVGSGWKTHQTDLESALGNAAQKKYPDILPSAQDVATLAVSKFKERNISSAEHAVPVYLRNNIAKKSSKPDNL